MNFTKQQLEQIECLRRKNFAPEDFFVSKKAEEHNINNIPSSLKEAKSVIANLMVVADTIQRVRDILEQPIIINSAYRCLAVNRLVGSKDNSQHILGQAVDFVCPKFGNPSAIFLTLKNLKIKTDQCLLENGWVHLSIKEKDNRNMWGKIVNGRFIVA